MEEIREVNSKEIVEGMIQMGFIPEENFKLIPCPLRKATGFIKKKSSKKRKRKRK